MQIDGPPSRKVHGDSELVSGHIICLVKFQFTIVQETITLDQQLAALSKLDAAFREGFQWSENPLDDLIGCPSLPRCAVMVHWGKRSCLRNHLLSLFVYVGAGRSELLIHHYDHYALTI